MSESRTGRTPRVTPAGAQDHPAGDNPVDSVDNAVHERLRRVDAPPERVTGHPHGGASAAEPVTQQDGAAPNEQGESGRDLAMAALQDAQRRAAARGTQPGVRSRRATGGGSRRSRRRRWSGPGADDRDPQPLGRLASRIAADRGWATKLTNGKVFGEWSRLVGADVAEHAEPVSLQDGELTVRARSTAWATQLRLLQSQLIAKIAAGVGHGVVKRIKIQGPTSPSWRHGPRHVPGRGPRDTYG